MLPYRERIIHVRWSGEACWIPLGDLDLGLGYENQTSYPAPGEIILYPGGISETEILLAYGGVRFASKVGQLAGNHFLTVIEGVDQLRPLGQVRPLGGSAGYSVRSALKRDDFRLDHIIIASQRVRPEVAGPRQSNPELLFRDCFVALRLLAMTVLDQTKTIKLQDDLLGPCNILLFDFPNSN